MIRHSMPHQGRSFWGFACWVSELNAKEKRCVVSRASKWKYFIPPRANWTHDRRVYVHSPLFILNKYIPSIPIYYEFINCSFKKCYCLKIQFLISSFSILESSQRGVNLNLYPHEMNRKVLRLMSKKFPTFVPLHFLLNEIKKHVGPLLNLVLDKAIFRNDD